MWTVEQRKRLSYENGILKHYGLDRDFKFYNPSDNINCQLIGTIKSSYGKEYKIRIRLGGFPDICPEAYIISPIMYDYYGRKLLDYGTSHAMHLLSPRDNETHICLYKSDYWRPNKTLFELVLKAKYWIEAYEQHMRTGKDIDCFVNTYR